MTRKRKKTPIKVRVKQFLFDLVLRCSAYHPEFDERCELSWWQHRKNPHWAHVAQDFGLQWWIKPDERKALLQAKCVKR